MCYQKSDTTGRDSVEASRFDEAYRKVGGINLGSLDARAGRGRRYIHGIGRIDFVIVS